MFKLLNKISWILSYILGFIIIFMFGIMIDEMNGQYAEFLDDDMFFIWIIWNIINAMIIKKIFFSENFIQSRLEVFASGLEQILSLKKKEKKSPKAEPNIALENTTEVISEVVKEPDHTNNEQIKIQSEINSENYEDDTVVVKQEKISEPSAFVIYIKKFFSENILAKIGSILVFLGVVFLMSLIWNQIPDTLKVIIGFAIGFGTYFVGVKLDKKGYVGESRILLGTGILINFLVILAAKYILNFGLFNLDPVEMGFIATGITLLFLVLNTIFGVITSLVYNSRTLLVFSFIFAYINPFLTGGSMDTPYTLAGYSLVVSLGALYVGGKQKDDFLKYAAFIGGNILLLLAPFQSEIGWITLLVSSALLGLLTILSFTKSDVSKIPAIFIGNYIVIILLLISGGDNNILSNTSSFISYMLSILFFFGIGIWLFLKELMLSITSVLIFPILIILGLIFTGTVTFIAPALAIVVLAYLVGFNNIQSSLSPILKYVFFGLLGGFIFMVNSFFSFNSIDLTLSSFITVILITFVFLFTSYYLSTKKNLEFLYTIGTLGGIFMLSPVLITKYVRFSPSSDMNVLEKIWSENYMFQISIIAIIIFALANIILPFVNKQLTQQGANIKNLLTGSIFGILFIGFQLFNYGSIYFPGISLGLSFGILAILYFILSSVMMNKLGIENVKKEITEKNIVLSYLFISISLFSVAIALVFSNNPEIISTVWLFEATILFYFYSKTQENKIGILGLILFIIGTLQLFDLSVSKGEFLFLIPLALIAISLVFNLKYLDSKIGVLKNIHDVFHILGIGMMSVLLLDIIPSTGHGWSMLAIAIGISILSLIYAKFSSNILKIFFIIIFALFAFGQYEDLSRVLRNIDRDELSYLRILQYGAYVIMGAIVYLWNKINLKTFYNKFVNLTFILYSLAIVSYFVYDIFSTTFAITIFWGLIASLFLFYGINVEKIKLRTSGLYLLSLVLGKIFIYDIWYLDDAVTRVIALMIIGVLLIMISIQYTSKYGNNLVGEFNPNNLLSDSEEIEKITIPLVNKHIEDIDISDIDSVKFYPNGDKNFTSKAKNLKKIVRMILEEKPCGTFAPNELLDTYNYIVNNYKSELSKRDFDIVNGAIQKFVANGGKVEIKK